jgi:hypothetical protein
MRALMPVSLLILWWILLFLLLSLPPAPPLFWILPDHVFYAVQSPTHEMPCIGERQVSHLDSMRAQSVSCLKARAWFELKVPSPK